MKKPVLVIHFSLRVPGIDDPESDDAQDVIDDVTIDLKGALAGWEWSLDEVWAVDANDKVDGYEIHTLTLYDDGEYDHSEGNSVDAYGVFEHYTRGGVEWLKNFDTAAEARAYVAGLGGPLTVDIVDEEA